MIEVCEELAECDAQVNNVPVGVLKAARGILRSFQWARDASDRLAFAEVLATNEDFTADMTETYKVCCSYFSKHHDLYATQSIQLWYLFVQILSSSAGKRWNVITYRNRTPSPDSSLPHI